MRRLIFALLIVATTTYADHKHEWESKTDPRKCCLSGEKEPNCTGTQTRTYLACKCGAERSIDSTACQ